MVILAVFFPGAGFLPEEIRSQLRASTILADVTVPLIFAPAILRFQLLPKRPEGILFSKI